MSDHDAYNFCPLLRRSRLGDNDVHAMAPGTCAQHLFLAGGFRQADYLRNSNRREYSTENTKAKNQTRSKSRHHYSEMN